MEKFWREHDYVKRNIDPQEGCYFYMSRRVFSLHDYLFTIEDMQQINIIETKPTNPW